MTALACSPEELIWLREKWGGLTASAKSSVEVQRAWNFLEAQYSHSSRHYHNLSHILALLRHAETMHAYIADPQTVEFAIWFHDVIYDTLERDNERRSARWASKMMHGMRLDGALVSAVERCILATQKHEVDWFDIPDLPLFLDLDLAILGASEDIYRKYSAAVRQEYDWVLDASYRFARRRVLKGFLDRPKVFFTPVMADRFENQARRNMEKEFASFG